jgi:hypothetical protein
MHGSAMAIWPDRPSRSHPKPIRAVSILAAYRVEDHHSATTTLAVARAIAATTYGGLSPVCLTQARTQKVLTMYAPRS